MRPVLAAMFVPGSRPDRFEKAVQSGADAVILDLEDAVPLDQKVMARAEVESWLRANHHQLHRIAIRINPVDSREFAADALFLESLRNGQALPHTVMLPKAEGATDLNQVHPLLAETTSCLALIESAAGLMNIQEIAAHKRTTQLAFGAADYAASVGCSLSDSSLLYARSLIVAASASESLPQPLDSPCFAIDDAGAVQHHAQHGRELGFGGSLCIHPAQVASIRSGYLPDEAEVAWAQNILKNAATSGASRVGNDMVDAPVILRAQRIINAHESE